MEKYYKNYLEVDKDNLDEECIQQPVLYDKFASQVPDLVNDVDIAKADMEFERASLYKEIVEEAIKSGGKKPTEKDIEKDILLNEKFVGVQHNYFEAKKKAEQAKVVKEVFMQRKDMIRGLIELHNSTYFSRVETKIDKSVKESHDKSKMRGKKGKRRGE
tara:strand:- start:725 stop:1204 length:480 start_codon:yes stop_codon:yes gene_type:complete